MRGGRRGVGLAVLLVTVVSMGLGLAAAGMPTDDTDRAGPTVEMETGDTGYDVSDLEQRRTGADIDSSLFDAGGEQVVVLDVAQNIDTSSLGAVGDSAALLRADSQATLTPVVERVEQLESATVRNTIWTGNLVTVEVDLDEQSLRALAGIDGVARVVPNVEFQRPTPVSDGVEGVGESAGPILGATQDSYDVAVVGSTAQPNSTYGMDYMQTVLAENLENSTYSIDAVHPDPDEDHPQNQTILELMDGYDAFVVNTMGGIDSEAILGDFLDNLTANQTAVYLDAYNNGDAIEELSDVRNDPSSASDDFIEDQNTTFVELDVTTDHPIFEGLGSAGESIPVRSVPQQDTDFVLYTSFSGYSGDVVADVTPDNGLAFGPGAAVNNETGEVLLTIGQGDSISAWNDDGTQTASAEQLLVNAVQHVTTGVSPPDEDPVDLDLTYGLEQMGIPGFEDTFDGERGGNATVAIVDDGLSDPENGHPDLDIAQKFLVQNGQVTNGTVEEGQHGEHVAGTATGAANPVGDVPRFGVAPEAELLLFDAFGTSGGATFEDIALALELAAQEGADVGGFSLGAANGSFSESTFEPTFTSTVEEANAAGMVVSVSAGNEGTGPDGGQVTSPGTQFDSITVGASTETKNIAGFSSGAVIQDETVRQVLGDPVTLPEQFPREYVKPDVSAAGQGVLSSGPLGGDIGDPAATYSFSSGTSMAQPHVAGAVALLQSVTDAQVPPKAIETALAETAEKPAGAPGGQTERDIRYGTGIINMTAAALALQSNQEISGTVTSNETAGGLVGATVESENGGLTTARENGTYTLYPTEDPVNLTADAFGYESETATVSGSAGQDFELDPTVAAEIIDGQPTFVVAGNSFDIVVDVANLENITVDLTAESNISAENLTVSLGDQELPLGTTVDLNGSVGGEVTLTVETDGGIEDGSVFGLVHALAGEGDELVVETGPTEVTEDVPPAAFEITDISVQETVTTDEPIQIVADVENVGGETGTTETLTGIEGPTVDGGETLVFFPPDTVELDPGETTSLQTDFGTVEDVNGAIGSVEWEPGDELTAVQQVGESLNPNEPPEPTIEDNATAPFSVVEEQIESPFFAVSNLSAPTQADPGATINVSATVTNVGNTSGTQTVEFVFDGSVAATEPDVELAPDEETLVEFTDIQLPTAENIYEHGVFTANDSQNGTITVGQPDPPAFELTNLTQPDELTVKGSIEAEVELTNVGGAAGQTQVLYGTDIDGNFIFIPANIGTVQLDAGESTTISQSLLTFQDINAQLGTDYGPGDEVLTGFQVGEDLNPNEPPEPVIEDELAADISIVPETPEIALSNLDIGGSGDNVTLADGAYDVTVEMVHTGGGAGDVAVNLSIGDTELTQTVSIAVGETLTVTFENATETVTPGFYNLTVEALGTQVSGEMLLSVDVGGGGPATDTNSDGLLDDIDGDESFDIFDVQALFNGLESDAVQDNPGLFNFNDDEDPDEVTIFDVQGLFNELP
jgi:subtilisin family serine protease